VVVVVAVAFVADCVAVTVTGITKRWYFVRFKFSEVDTRDMRRFLLDSVSWIVIVLDAGIFGTAYLTGAHGFNFFMRVS